MDEKIKEQILAVRDTGLCNMFDIPFVERIAFDQNHYELVNFIEEHKDEYINFIFYGDRKE